MVECRLEVSEFDVYFDVGNFRDSFDFILFDYHWSVTLQGEIAGYAAEVFEGRVIEQYGRGSEVCFEIAEDGSAKLFKGQDVGLLSSFDFISF